VHDVCMGRGLTLRYTQSTLNYLRLLDRMLRYAALDVCTAPDDERI
jgi:hypothetical protein